MTIKELREKIESKTLTAFELQEAVKFFAENIDTMTLGAEVAFKEYIRKGAYLLDIHIEDLQAVYNSFRKVSV
jgi:hypothetical protein